MQCLSTHRRTHVERRHLLLPYVRYSHGYDHTVTGTADTAGTTDGNGTCRRGRCGNLPYLQKRCRKYVDQRTLPLRVVRFYV